MKSRLRFAVRFILFAGAMLISMELAARIDDLCQFGAPLFKNYDFDRLFVFDGRVMRGVPHARYAKWTLNSLGMRGPEPAPLQGQTRVVVFGASEVFGIYESDGKNLPQQLDVMLNATSPVSRYEVMNAGIPGMRVGSGIDYLREIGARLHPAVVVIYPTPTHYIGVSRPNCGRPFRPPATQNNVTWPALRLMGKSVDRIKQSMPKPVLTLARRGTLAWAMRNTATLQSVDPASLAAFEIDMACAINAVRGIGAVPIIVTHANRFRSTGSADDAYWLTGWRAQYPELAEGGFIALEERANQSIRRIADANRVRLVDAGAALGGDPANFADHAHFSDAGAEKMARLLAEAVAQSNNTVF